MQLSKDQFAVALSRLLIRRPDLAAKAKGSGVDLGDLIARASRPFAPFESSHPLSIVENLGIEDDSSVQESIVEAIKRPTVFVSNGDFDLPANPDSAARLDRARRLIKPRLSSVGRIEVFDGAVKWPVGTAWVAADGIAVTNRHVAEKFAQLNSQGKPEFQTDFRSRPYHVTIDFAEERGSPLEIEIVVEEVLYLALAGTPDLALLRLSKRPDLPRPIPLLANELELGDWVGVVGYPGRDDRIPERGRKMEEHYFGGIYGVKRLSPGEIDPVDGDHLPWVMAHDATTLGGNSGSVLIDLATGSAAGVHFRGDFLKANYAVRATALARLLNDLSFPAVSVAPPPPQPDPVDEAGAEEAAVPDEFPGYNPKFIAPRDQDFKILLPKITDNTPGTVAKLKDGGTVLTYRNFSIEMRAERRLCYYSAVNIDGSATFSIRGERPGWKFDDRLDRALQIKGECYGRETDGKFSRGHMTRREDPNWGKKRADAEISNAHTFFVTNACPQIQPFNAGIWLSLEDYALENCDQDDMRISVFTGPIFRDADPEFFGVKVPVEFWKVIAFKHDETKELTATGYRMSQRNVLPSDGEFVFGPFAQSQVSIRSIEKVTGLDFHQLRECDPIDTGEESLGDVIRPLRSLSEITFKKA